MRLYLLLIAVLTTVSSCSQQEETKRTFTLSTGVSLIDATACSETPVHDLIVSKSASDYVVIVGSMFSCGSEVNAPYMSLTRDKKATLVLDSNSKSTCDCFRRITVRLSDRLNSGDILYVLNNGEVLGHSVMP